MIVYKILIYSEKMITKQCKLFVLTIQEMIFFCFNKVCVRCFFFIFPWATIQKNSIHPYAIQPYGILILQFVIFPAPHTPPITKTNFLSKQDVQYDPCQFPVITFSRRHRSLALNWTQSFHNLFHLRQAI